MFELGLRRKWCQTNPVKLAERPVIKTTETRIKFLDQAELEKLLAITYPEDAFGSVEATMYLTAAMTGLRQGELLGLRWRDVDFAAGKVRVVSPYVRGEFGDPKSEGSGRSVPLAERVAEALEDLRARSPYAADKTSSSAIPRPGIRSTGQSSSGDSKKRSAARTCARSPSTSCATPSVRAWRPPGCPCGRSSTGWATPTPRRPRSTPTTSLQIMRRIRSIRRLRSPAVPLQRGPVEHEQDHAGKSQRRGPVHWGP